MQQIREFQQKPKLMQQN